MVTLNRAIALAEIKGPHAGLELLSAMDSDAWMVGHHRLHAVRAHLLETAGDLQAAHDGYKLAARSTASPAERRYLEIRAARLNTTEAH
jgi:predicted RNA polymerase sigma factor